jgi:chromosome segregation ATPase
MMYAEDKILSDQSGNPISYYVDDLRDSWRSLRLYIFSRSVAEPSTDGIEGGLRSSPAELDALARTNEELRDRCINIVNRADDLLTLRNEFIEVFGEVGKILKNTEGTSASLVQRSTMLALEEEEHAALKVRHRALHEENESHRSENSALRGEIQRYGELVSGREARIQELETELTVEKDTTATLQAALEQERFMANMATEKLQAAVANIRNNEVLIETLQAHNAALSDRCSTAEFHSLALQDNLAQSVSGGEQLRENLAAMEHKAEGLAQGLSAAEAEMANFRKRTDTLEATLSTTRIEHDMAQTLWQQRGKENRDEIAGLEAQLSAERSRADAADQLLAATRVELNAKDSDLRAKESHADQLEAKITPLSERAEESRKLVAELEAKATEDEKARARLADRAQALVRAMNDKRAKLESAEERAELLKERLANETTKSAADIELLEQKIHALTVQLEKEKNARIVMSGALEAARSNVTRRRPISSMRDILTRAEEAEPQDRDRPWPWTAEQGPKRLELSPNGGGQESNVEQGTRPAAPSARSELSLPKTRPLVVRRDRQRSDGRQ